MRLPRAPFKGVLFEDHFGYGHIQFQKNETFWSRHFPSYAKAANVARDLGLISYMHLEAICHRHPNYPRQVNLLVVWDRDVQTVINEEFVALRPS